MSFQRKQRHRRGRIWRARQEAKRLAAERQAADPANAQAPSGNSNTPGPNPIALTGSGLKAPGTEAGIPRQDAQGRPGSRGSGDSGPEPNQTARTPQEASHAASPAAQQAQQAPQGFQTALFERKDETRSDARLARRAILNRWRPKPEATEAVLTKATVMALKDEAKANEVIAVAKLHLEAHKTVVSDEHHGDRMDYHERALQIRTKVGDYIPAGGPPINISTGGGHAAVSIFLPAKEEIPDLDRLDQP
jgi:hypothetical protein